MQAIIEPHQKAPEAGKSAKRVFDLDAFDRITKNLGYDTDYKRARQMDMSGSVLSRIRKGKARPGEKFIERLDRVGVQYDQVFPRQKVSA